MCLGCIDPERFGELLLAQLEFLKLSVEEQRLKYAESMLALGSCPKMYNDNYIWHDKVFALPSPLDSYTGTKLLMYAAAACYQYGLYNQLLAAEIMNLYEAATGKTYTFSNGKHRKTVAQEKAHNMSRDPVLYRAVSDHSGFRSLKGFPNSAVYLLLQRTDYTAEEQGWLREHIDGFTKFYGKPQVETQVTPIGWLASLMNMFYGT